MSVIKHFARRPRSHHVDGVFIEGVPVGALGVVHQNLGLEGASDGALLKGLTWNTDSTQADRVTRWHLLSEQGSVCFR